MENLSHRAMYAVLAQRLLTTRKADREAADELERSRGTEKGAYGATIRLVPRPYVKDLDYIRQACAADHKHLTIATDVKGLRILPTTLYERHADRMNHWSEQHKIALDMLTDSWDSIVENVVPKYIGRDLYLGELPHSSELAQYFGLDISYRPIPDNYKDWRLEGISPDDAEHLRRFSENDAAFMWAEAVKDVYGRAHKIMEDFADLVAKPDGKGMKQERTMEKLKDFADTLHAMNIWGDQTLEEAHVKMQEIINHTAEELRGDEALRNQVASASLSVTELLAKYR